MPYTDRRTEEITIKRITPEGEVSTDGGMAFMVPPEYIDQIHDGDAVELETRGLSLITGLRKGGAWVWRKTDEDLDREHQEMIARHRADNKNRADWTTRETRLPSWLQARLRTFRERGTDFDITGWGYELVICELAVLYVDSRGEETDAVNEYSVLRGTTGNQHGCAKALARAKAADPEFTGAGTVAGLAPITGKPFYE